MKLPGTSMKTPGTQTRAKAVKPGMNSPKPEVEAGRIAGALGLETVKVIDEGDTFLVLARLNRDPEVAFLRIKYMLSKDRESDIGKKYLIKSGQLVYAWYVRVRKDRVPNILSLAREAKKLYPYEEVEAELYIGSVKEGKLAESGAGEGQGGGVIPPGSYKGLSHG